MNAKEIPIINNDFVTQYFIDCNDETDKWIKVTQIEYQNAWNEHFSNYSVVELNEYDVSINLKDFINYELSSDLNESIEDKNIDFDDLVLQILNTEYFCHLLNNCIRMTV